MSKIDKNLENEYKSRINKTFDYIESRIAHSFTLEELAEVANFSKFHFHRIFQGIVGETPFRFIQRLRLERAASRLTTQPTESISDVAWKCGFADLSVFSRNFKKYFGTSPSGYRDQHRNFSQTESKPGQDDQRAFIYFCYESQTMKWRTQMKLNKSVEVTKLPDMTVAYVRHIGPYKGDENLFERLWNQLFTWAGARGLIGGPEFHSLIVYHDDPNVTRENNLRTSVCITVPPDTKVNGEVGKMELEGGDYVKARFELTAEQFEEAWEWLYGQWFPESGYQPDDKPPFEMYPEEPKDNSFTVDICVPVKPM